MISFTNHFLLRIAIPFFWLVVCAQAQSRMVINNNCYMVINGGGKLVIQNPNTNAISTTGSGANIVSENEDNQVKWMIGNNTGSYTIPFTSSDGVKIPMDINITSSGSLGGYILFSTYAGWWLNLAYMPSDVTHMNNLFTGLNNSVNTIDRFWIVDALGYGVKPAGEMAFTYKDDEHSVAMNTITESELRAQRFNNTLNTWGDYLPSGSINTTSNVVSNIPFDNTSFFRSWTLAENSNPLPVELLNAQLWCDNGQPILSWITASETNNSFFTIGGSMDAINYSSITDIPGSGTTNITHSYSYECSNDYRYFKLSQTDFDGTIEELGVFYNQCRNDLDWNIWYANSPSGTLLLQDKEEHEIHLELFSTNGQLVWQQSVFSTNGILECKLPLDLCKGVYVAKAQRKNQIQTLKIIL